MLRSAFKFVFGVLRNGWVLTTLALMFAAFLNLGWYLSQEPPQASLLAGKAVWVAVAAALLYLLTFGLVYCMKMRELWRNSLE